MPVLSIECDVCGKVCGKGQSFVGDYDGRFLCKKCDYELKLSEKQREICELKKWLKDTHLKKLRRLNRELFNLKDRHKGE